MGSNPNAPQRQYRRCARDLWVGRNGPLAEREHRAEYRRYHAKCRKPAAKRHESHRALIAAPEARPCPLVQSHSGDGEDVTNVDLVDYH